MSNIGNYKASPEFLAIAKEHKQKKEVAGPAYIGGNNTEVIQRLSGDIIPLLR